MEPDPSTSEELNDSHALHASTPHNPSTSEEHNIVPQPPDDDGESHLWAPFESDWNEISKNLPDI